jgi:hypothetical protein
VIGIIGTMGIVDEEIAHSHKCYFLLFVDSQLDNPAGLLFPEKKILEIPHSVSIEMLAIVYICQKCR